MAAQEGERSSMSARIEQVGDTSLILSTSVPLDNEHFTPEQRILAQKVLATVTLQFGLVFDLVERESDRVTDCLTSLLEGQRASLAHVEGDYIDGLDEHESFTARILRINLSDPTSTT